MFWTTRRVAAQRIKNFVRTIQFPFGGISMPSSKGVFLCKFRGHCWGLVACRLDRHLGCTLLSVLFSPGHRVVERRLNFSPSRVFRISGFPLVHVRLEVTNVGKVVKIHTAQFQPLILFLRTVLTTTQKHKRGSISKGAKHEVSNSPQDLARINASRLVMLTNVTLTRVLTPSPLLTSWGTSNKLNCTTGQH